MALSTEEKRENQILKWTKKYIDAPVEKVFNKGASANPFGLAVTYQKLIRMRHATDSGLCICITCNRAKHWKNINGGHYVGRANKATTIDYGNGLIQNVWPQCIWCNDFKAGARVEFRSALVEKFSELSVVELENAKFPKHHVWDYRQLATLKVGMLEEIKIHKIRLGV